MVDFDKAVRDPSAVFATPGDVVDAPGLSLAQKLEILRQWELDARELAVAEEENMGGGEESALHRVLEARARLESRSAETPAPPTKHGGASLP